MEINHERLRGKPAGWVNSVKEDVSPAMDEDFERIKAKKVRINSPSEFVFKSPFLGDMYWMA